MGNRTFIMFLLLLTNFTLNVMDSGSLTYNLEEKITPFSFNVDMATAANYIFLQSPSNNSILPSDTRIVLDIDDTSLLRVDFNWDSQPNITWLPPYTTLLPPGDGPHILHVYALDSLDVWEYQKFHFITDDTTPIILLESLVNNSKHIPETPVELLINDTNLDNVLYHWNAEENQSLFFPFIVNLPREDGSHRLSVYVSDAAGNWGSEKFQFSVRIELSPDSDNDGLSDYIEFLLGTDPTQATEHIADAPMVIDDLNTDVPDDLYTTLVSHDHIPAQNWIVGTVNEEGLEDPTDYYIFTSEIRTKGTVILQSNLPGVQLYIFDLEGRVNSTVDVQLLSLTSGNGADVSTLSNYVPNALPYLVEIPIPLAVELLVIQVDGGFAGNSFYSIWIDETPTQPHLELLIIVLNLLLFLGLPFLFFLTLRWENRRLTKKQRSMQEKLVSDSEFPAERTTPKKFPVIVNVRFSEWVFSSVILSLMALLFTELSREKFQNQVTVLTAKGFVDLGYRIFFLAVTFILLGTLLSLINWGKNRFRGQISVKHPISWTRRFLDISLKVVMVGIVYFILWMLFVRFIVLVQASYSSSSSLNDLLDLFQAFFVKDLSTPPSSEQITLLSNMGILELIFIVFTLPLALYMFILNFAGGTSVRAIFRPAEQKKSRWNYKTVILAVSLSIELYRVFSNLLNFLISLFLTENTTFFFIQISELPWWHQLVTWVSQETLISTPVLYGLYFELQGIFFAWVIYTSLPSIFRRFMSGSGYSRSIIRIGVFLLGMFVIFLRTLHLLLLIPIGVPSFTFSVILTEPFSILLLIAMISESLEILGFSLGLILVVYYQKVRKRPQKVASPSVQPIPLEEPHVFPVIESSFQFQIEEE